MTLQNELSSAFLTLLLASSAMAAEPAAKPETQEPPAAVESPAAAAAPAGESPASAEAPAAARPAAAETPAAAEAPAAAARPAAAETPAAATAPAARAPAKADDVFTLAAVGDVMLGSAFPEDSILPPEDGRDLLAEVAPVIRAADLAIGNLEGPLVDDGESTKCSKKKTGRCFAFRVPTRYGQWLKDAGFDVMGLANNHAMDFGAAGMASSRQVLDALGIGHSGPIGDVARLEVKGRKVAVIAFATYGGMYDLNDLEAARQAIEELKAESDLVIVSFHGGAEGIDKQNVAVGNELFLGERRGDLRAFARTAIDAGAAVVIGHGPHVVRGMEVYKGHLIAYSLGNFATWEKMSLSGPLGETLVLEVKLAPDGRFLGGKIHAARQVKPGGPKWDPSGKVIRDVMRLSAADFAESAVQVRDDGTLLPPGTPSVQPAGAEQ